MRTANTKTGQSRNARILIADDHDVIRRGLRAVLESHPGWTVCADCKNGREAIEKVQVLRPDVAVLDITMPELNGIEAARHIQKAAPGTEILLVSLHYTDQLARQILAAGIRQSGGLLGGARARYVLPAC